MTNNQWKNDYNRPAWETVGADCSAVVRMPGFARVFSELDADVIGLQEVSPLMLSELVENLQRKGMSYSVLWGADTPIMYKPEKLELIDSAFAFYSERIEGFEGKYNNDKTKSYTVAVFRVKDSGKLFVFASTHLWWMDGDPSKKNYMPSSDEARAYQIDLLMDVAESFAQKYGCPSVIVGDLNADYSSLALSSAFRRGYLHGHDIATEYKDETNGNHYCFGDGYRGYEPLEFEKGIDHILLKGVGDDAVKRFDRYYPEYYMPLSDHFPAYIDIDF